MIKNLKEKNPIYGVGPLLMVNVQLHKGHILWKKIAMENAKIDV